MDRKIKHTPIKECIEFYFSKAALSSEDKVGFFIIKTANKLTAETLEKLFLLNLYLLNKQYTKKHINEIIFGKCNKEVNLYLRIASELRHNKNKRKDKLINRLKKHQRKIANSLSKIKTYKQNEILKALNKVKGLWKDREINPSEFMRNIREDRTLW